MQKNGFTLVEMMTVIIIMVLLGLIAVFSISGIVKTSTDKLYQLQINSILDASRTYAVKNSNTLSDNNEITLCDLKRSSLLDDVKNPKTDEPFDDGLIVKIVKNEDGEFDFSFDGVSKMEGYSCDKDIAVSINGDSPLFVKIGEAFDDKGVIVKRNNLVCTQTNGNATSNETNCYYRLNISGDYQASITDNRYSKSGTYKETYKITDGSFSSSITRTIVVQDKTPPVITVNYNGTPHTNSFSVRLVEGSTLNLSCIASDSGGSIGCTKEKDEYQDKPGTYDIIYTAKDSSGNSSALVVSVTVISKNKSLIAGVNIDNLDWTNDKVTLKIIPLYSSNNCSSYSYSFDGYIWSTNDTLEVTTNGEYKLGISCNTSSAQDVMVYKVSNIDKEAPSFVDNEASINVTQGVTSLEPRVKNGKTYYYSNGEVLITNRTPAVDTQSGVSAYEIYANDRLLEGGVLSGDGDYEIKVLAIDKVNNRSELKSVAHVLISSLKPTCEFIKCNSSACNDPVPITGSVSQNGSVFTINGGYPAHVNFRFSCTYQYYDGNEDIYEYFVPQNSGFYFLENGAGNPANISVEGISGEGGTIANCSNGICTKTNQYLVSVNLVRTYNPGRLYLRPNSMCDRINNCNLNETSSVELWPN